MATLTINSVNVPLAPDGVRTVVEEIGDKDRTVGGRFMGAVRSRKLNKSLTTPPMTSSDFDDVYAELVGPQPVAVGGDVSNGVTSAVASDVSYQEISAPSGIRYMVSFTLSED